MQLCILHSFVWRRPTASSARPILDERPVGLHTNFRKLANIPMTYLSLCGVKLLLKGAVINVMNTRLSGLALSI